MHHARVIHLSTVGVQPSYHFAELDIEAKLLQNLQNYMHVGLVSGVVKHRVQDSNNCNNDEACYLYFLLAHICICHQKMQILVTK